MDSLYTIGYLASAAGISNYSGKSFKIVYINFSKISSTDYPPLELPASDEHNNKQLNKLLLSLISLVISAF